MNEIDFEAIDFVELFIEFREHLAQNLASAFLVREFVRWLKQDRKFFKGYYKVKGSDHGQKNGDVAAEKLIEKIIQVFEESELIEMSNNHHNRRVWYYQSRHRIRPDAYDITDFGMKITYDV